LSELVPKAQGEMFVLEKASIDECYVDITKLCTLFQQHIIARCRTAGVNVETFGATGQPLQFEPSSGREWHCAALVAAYVRHTILDQLHFELSAGISCNKTLAKLASKKHKPNK
jgi:nucleotidyltransferase/DNA polymerase involved in DNA repair